MSKHATFIPNILDRSGVATLREAVRLAAKAVGTTDEQDQSHLTSIVLSFYRRGLVDPIRLAEIAVLASSSRLFRSQYSAGLHDLRSEDRASSL
jgi:hypothetical protein